MKKSKIALAILAIYLPAGTIAAQESDTTQAHASITVHEHIQPDEVNTQTLSAEKLQRIGANDFGSIMRYQPLISAPGVSGGSGNGKSSFDRSGYTGYNIRGLDANRISIDVEGIPLPNATGRSYDPFAGENTYGIGRDYIDPYLYGLVNISTGSLSQNRVNNVVGGSVSFTSKSPDDYLIGDKHSYFSYTSNFDTSNHSLHNGITSAFGSQSARILVAYSRRDGQQVRNNRRDARPGFRDTYPSRWNSDSFLINGVYEPNNNNRLSAIIDYYHKSSRDMSDLWNDGHGAGSQTIGTSRQKSLSQRSSMLLKHELTPENNLFIDKLSSQIFYQQTRVNDNTFDDQTIVTFTPDRRTGTPVPDPLWKTSTISGLETKTYGLNSEITKQYGAHSLNYGVNFATEQTTRPFSQIKTPEIPRVTWTYLQPQGNGNTYDINVWLGDTITAGSFSVLPQIKYSWHKISPKGFVNPATNAIGIVSPTELNNLYNTDFTDNQLLPALTLMYSLNNQLSSWIQYKRGVSYPTNSQMFGTWIHPFPVPVAMFGNTDLKTETSNQFELGVAGEALPGISLRGSVFYNDYDNFIANMRYNRDPTTGNFPGRENLSSRLPPRVQTVFIAENRDKAFIYGAELSSRINYGSWFSKADGLSSTFAIGYNQGRSKSAYPGDDWVDIDSVLPMKAIVALAYDDPARRYGASLTATFVKGKQAIDSFRQSFANTGTAFSEEARQARLEYMRIPGFGTLDLAAYYNVTPNISLNAGIYNITDRKYWDYASNKNLTTVTPQDQQNIDLGIAPGRTYQIGLTATF